MKQSLLASAFIAGVVAVPVAQAQDFPTKTITLTVPNPPGGMNPAEKFRQKATLLR